MKLIATYTEGALENLLPLAEEFSHYALLNSNGFTGDFHQYDQLLAVGCLEEKTIDQFAKSGFQRDGQWWFGITAYDFKNWAEEAVSDQKTGPWPTLAWFRPAIVLTQSGEKISMFADQDWTHLTAEIEALLCVEVETNQPIQPVAIAATIDRTTYLERVNRLKQEIRKGSIYEVNFCQEFSATGVNANPIALYQKLNRFSPMPFSSLFKFRDKYAISSSPERFFQLDGNVLRSQPIKGSIGRGKTDAEDRKHKEHLLLSQKERSENVMIVDLVRNDIGKLAKAGTVSVVELFQIKTFKRIHQMVSTVVGEIDPNAGFESIFKALFPMGSMTGAPKVKAMQLIDQYESGPRGWYSGCLGYITPDGDMDFSVLIRTMMYDTANQTVNYWVGGAITDQADPESEFEECLLKAQPFFQIFQDEKATATIAAGDLQ